ncbi:hypothetical protein [Paraflavitalea speifideaquila]|uniref:hypothetical protein n=1 Tax=Paraflavitalea speifideaquila TaxID=3076558 RepID=UPI0028EAE808|nr:hypothetical protein [Paraflavitalea speifideiaquila]
MRVTILFLLIHVCLTGKARQTSTSVSIASADSFFILQQKIAGTFTDFTVDNLGNIYVLSQSGQLKKDGSGW